MKTRILMIAALVVSTMMFAQKKEVKAIEKAVKAGNFTQAKSLLGAAEGFLSTMDDKTKQKFLLLKAKSFLGQDNRNIADLEKAVAAFQMLKGTNLDSQAVAGIGTAVLGMVNGAVDDQKAGSFIAAADKLEKAYSLSKKDTSYLYYAAANAVNGKNFDKALGYYEQLKNLGYTGIKTEYKATNKETGVVETFNNEQERDFNILAKTHIKPEESPSESQAGEIAKNVALIYISQGNNDKAIEALEDAKKSNPNDIALLRSEAEVYLKMEKMDKYKETINKVLELDPNNPELYYNLGVIADQAGNKEESKGYYEKAVELNPKYASAYNNLAVLVLSQETAIVDEMNSLGTSNADYARYDVLKEKRQGLYKSAIPYLEKALEANPEYLDVARTLYNIYGQLGESSKADQMKALVDKLGG